MLESTRRLHMDGGVTAQSWTVTRTHDHGPSFVRKQGQKAIMACHSRESGTNAIMARHSRESGDELLAAKGVRKGELPGAGH